MEHGAVIGHAPVHIVVNAHAIPWALVFSRAALATSTCSLTAAVVVTDQVVLTIFGVVACSYPRHFRWLGTRWAGVHRPATAGAQVAVYGAVAPIFAIGNSRFFGGRCRLSICTPTAVEWKNRKHKCCCYQGLANANQGASARDGLCCAARFFLKPFI